ncbi:MAG: RusA family crossover junction endodeoxyribonuclease [Lachnospiraceae bacterium]|nr:RusA family crossover junction endodeoxyribonuclease [Lachnospiraceae bacterium]
MKIHFFIYMNPPTVTHQEKKVHVVHGKPVFYEPPELANARSNLISALAIHRPVKPIEKGCRLIVKWLFPMGKHKPRTYKTTKPDTDNLQKLLKDCMTQAGFWKDDALVASEIVEKFWNDIPGIHVCVEELDDDKQNTN